MVLVRWLYVNGMTAQPATHCGRTVQGSVSQGLQPPRVASDAATGYIKNLPIYPNMAPALQA